MHGHYIGNTLLHTGYHVNGIITRTSKRTQWTVWLMCLRLLKRSAQDTLHRWNAICVTTVQRITSHVLFHLFSARIRRRRRRRKSGLQPAPWLSAVMSPARTCALTNTPRWELIISSCDLGGKRREGRGRRERALVSLMDRERGAKSAATCEQARKSSCSLSYGNACSCLREKGDWLARVPGGAFMFLPVWGGDPHQNKEH